MKRNFLKTAMMLGALLGFGAQSVLASSDYIYRQRVNWVKLEKANGNKIPLSDLRHPTNSITVDQMEAMLLSIKINKNYLIKSGMSSLEIFNTFEARKYAPLIVEALSKASSDQVVNFSIVHKRPMFILRNDLLTMGNVFVAADGVHFQFTKLFAQLQGDYQASTEINKAFRKAKTSRVALEAGEGQVLSYTDPYEVIMSTSHNFASGVRERDLMRQREDADSMRPASKRGKRDLESSESGGSYAKSPTERLKELDGLKAQKLVTEAEYQQLRKKILSEL